MIRSTFENLKPSERSELYKVRTELIFEIFDVLEKHNVNGFIDTGTLLGAYRDGEYIPWDSDADIGVRGEEMTEAVIEEFKKRFNIVDEKRDLNNRKFFKIVKRDIDGKHLKFKRTRVECDIYHYYPEGGFRIMSDFPTTWIHPVPSVCIDELDQITWYGRKLNIPSNTPLYLRQWYGDTWHKPEKTFDYSPNRYLIKDWNSFKRKELEDDLPERIIETSKMDFTPSPTKSKLF